MNQCNIRFVGLDRLYSKYRTEYRFAADRVLASGVVIGGPHVEMFEKRIAMITNRRFAVAVASCTDALFFILRAYGIGPGDEVITTAFSFVATASSIIRTGAIPVFVDVDEYFHMDISEIHLAKSDRTKAVVAVNLLGDCVDFTAFEKYCYNENLLLIEDAAQSFGSKYRNIPSGKLGQASALSFSPMKPVPCFGTAGAVVTDDDEIYNTCRLLRRHGKSGNLTAILGYNSVIPADKAAQLNVNLRYMDAWHARRTIVAEKYISGLEGVADIVTPRTREHVVHCWHKFVIRTSRRDELRRYLSEKGIETQVHYAVPLPADPMFGTNDPYFFSRSMNYSRTCLSLPIYAELRDEEVDYIVQTIRDRLLGQQSI